MKLFVETKWALLDSDKDNVYVYVKEVLDELKKYKKGGASEASEMSDIQSSPKVRTNLL